MFWVGFIAVIACVAVVASTVLSELS